MKLISTTALLLMLSLTTFAAEKKGPAVNTLQARPAPAWLTGGVMYQIQPRAFTPEGTLKAATARLPKVAELGVDIVYLCPIFVQDDDMRRESWSPRQIKSGMNNPRNPYRIKDYYHVDPEYGTDADLKDFVAAAHKLKMRVMLDMVYLHCGPTAVFLKDHPDFAKHDKDGKAINSAWRWPELNYASPELREYLWKNMEYWVKDFDVDGFRCDVADGVPLDFWEAGRERLEKIRPDVGMLAEGNRPANQLKAFDLCYSWIKWDDASQAAKIWKKLRDERPRGGARFIRFIENHDTANEDYNNRLEKRWGYKRFNAALAVIFTIDGVPFVYNGEEATDVARHSIFGPAPIEWASGETVNGKARFELIQKLCAMRHAEKALTQGEVVWVKNDAPKAVLSFVRTLGDEQVLSAVNLTDKPVKVQVSLPAKSPSAFRELVAQEAKAGENGEFELGAHGFFIGKR